MEPTTPKQEAMKKFVADHLNQADEGNVLIIREGEAPKLPDCQIPKKIRISGTIHAPSDFYEKRGHLHNPDKCHVIFDKSAGTIVLTVDEQFTDTNYEITGKIELNPDLVAFKINSNSTWTIKSLMELLKFNRIHFQDRDVNSKIVASLQSFKARVEKIITDSSNLRGNDEKSLITNLEHELDEKFILNIPIFKGAANESFVVEICISATSGEVQVWLESRELKELMDRRKESLMDSVLEKFSRIVCIEK